MQIYLCSGIRDAFRYVRRVVEKAAAEEIGAQRSSNSSLKRLFQSRPCGLRPDVRSMGSDYVQLNT